MGIGKQIVKVTMVTFSFMTVKVVNCSCNCLYAFTEVFLMRTFLDGQVVNSFSFRDFVGERTMRPKLFWKRYVNFEGALGRDRRCAVVLLVMRGALFFFPLCKNREGKRGGERLHVG